mgnify:CR=1 FL=1
MGNALQGRPHRLGDALLVRQGLLLQGGADKLVDPEGAQMLFETVGSSDKTIKIYEGLYHEIFNEPERGQVLDHMEQWLENHLK